MRKQTISRIIKGTEVQFFGINPETKRTKSYTITLPYIDRTLKTGAHRKSMDKLQKLYNDNADSNDAIILFTINHIQFFNHRYIMDLADFVKYAHRVESADHTEEPKTKKNTKK